MKLIFIIALGITAATAQNPANPWGWWCNDGTAGDGSCESKGGNTFCYFNDPKHPGYTTPRNAYANSKDPKGSYTCGPDNQGQIRCVKK
ncbi:hypothetical protein HYFRA_00006132 [Hymenoscyphus fraxineus]|uniref:Uncharacterized protein n=1 Tax=Hymenoscyphus fraxineus TaxID=746836 RepID=A0A9N9Q1B2_9HELO|nr:hypothetical protein HYFRA_00006132 [Hymenoscyphus fraxineus]